MTTIDDQGRTEPPLDADELATLQGFLEFHRATLEWKTDGLDSEQLNATTAASTMTLGGLLKHLALVEDDWFSVKLWDNPAAEPWASVDWDADRDWEWHTAATDDPDELRELWRSSVRRSRELLAHALENDGLSQVAKRPFANGDRASLRWILIHMIEEYSRHNGHADLLREAIDGSTGE